MKALLCLGTTLLLYVSLWLTGCGTETNIVADTANATETSSSAPEPVEPQEKDKPKKGLLDKATDLLDKAKSGGSEGSELAKEWLGKTLKQTKDSSSSTTEDSVQWAFDMYESLKEKGLTQSESAKDWLSEDFKSMGAWEYKVTLIPVADAEKKLNELGAERWECFDVRENTFFFKRQRQSYLRAIPLRDLMQLVPLMTNE